jgi:hypothetical protein
VRVVLVSAAGAALGERVVAQMMVAHPEHEKVPGLEFLCLLLAVAIDLLFGGLRLL